MTINFEVIAAWNNWKKEKQMERQEIENQTIKRMDDLEKLILAHYCSSMKKKKIRKWTQYWQMLDSTMVSKKREGIWCIPYLKKWENTHKGVVAIILEWIIINFNSWFLILLSDNLLCFYAACSFTQGKKYLNQGIRHWKNALRMTPGKLKAKFL